MRSARCQGSSKPGRRARVTTDLTVAGACGGGEPARRLFGGPIRLMRLALDSSAANPVQSPRRVALPVRPDGAKEPTEPSCGVAALSPTHVPAPSVQNAITPIRPYDAESRTGRHLCAGSISRSTEQSLLTRSASGGERPESLLNMRSPSSTQRNQTAPHPRRTFGQGPSGVKGRGAAQSCHLSAP